MEISLIVGVVGIIVSIGVGFRTFYLADKRAKRNRWENAKETVLRDLSKSLGEGNVPDALVIKATIRSVLRNHNTSDFSVVTLEEISDDLLRQITSDPFLEAERRKKLQEEVLSLKLAQVKLEEAMSPEDKLAENVKLDTSKKLTWSTIASLMAGIITSAAAAATIASFKPLFEIIKQVNTLELSKYGIAIIASFLTVIVSLISVFVSRKSKKK